MRVLVTRPHEAAQRTADRLRTAGHEPLLAPLMTVAPTGDPVPDGPVDALLVTSAHAAEALAGLERRTVFAVGERTAAAVRCAGFADVRVGPGDAAGLVAVVADTLPPPAALLHVAGRHRKPEPQRSLQASGYTILVWEAYEAIAAAALPSHVCAALAAGRIDAVLHYSRRSADLLVGLVQEAGLASRLAAVIHVCVSADAAAPLSDRGLPVRIAAEPHEVALLDTLEQATRVAPSDFLG